MNTVVVWVLIIVLHGSGSYVGYQPAPLVIDNIASQSNCEALKSIIVSTVEPDESARGVYGKCIQVRKVK